MQSVGVEFEAHSVVTCAALYKAFTFCKQEMGRYLGQLEKGQVRAFVLVPFSFFLVVYDVVHFRGFLCRHGCI